MRTNRKRTSACVPARMLLLLTIVLSLRPTLAMADGELVVMRSAQSGQYVRVGPDSVLRTESPAGSYWERMYLVRLGGSEVALRSAVTGKYVSAVGSGSKLNASAEHVAHWETFSLVELGGGKVALRLPNQKFVTAVGEPALRGEADHALAWESFILEASSGPDLEAYDFCYRLDSSRGTITVSPVVRNSGNAVWNEASPIEYAVGVTRNGVASERKHKIPLGTLAPGNTRELPGIEVWFRPGDTFRLPDLWMLFNHPADIARYDNRHPGLSDSLNEQDFLADGKLSRRVCSSGNGGTIQP